MSPKLMVHERAAAGALAQGMAEASGLLEVCLISPGWGSSGYYSEAVLKNAGAAKVFPAGTKMFFDHAGEFERRDRPERSVLDLAATLTEDARWEDGRLVAQAQVFGPYRSLLTDEDFAATIGVSIVAYADTTIGEAEGRKGTIITELTESVSADFVTWPGRGGAILRVMESARPEAVEARAIEHGVAEASANATREALASAVSAAYAADDRYVWVGDFDESRVWFSVESNDGDALFEQGYGLDANEAAVLVEGDPTPVRRVITYVPLTQGVTESGPWEAFISTHPSKIERSRNLWDQAMAIAEATSDAPAPAGQSNAIETQGEDMANIQIEETELGRLRQDAERVPTLESERDTANRRADTADERANTAEATLAAVRILHREAANVTVSTYEETGLLANLPVSEDGTLNADTYTATVQAFVAEKNEATGAGTVTGFGDTVIESGKIAPSWGDIDARLNIPTTKEG